MLFSFRWKPSDVIDKEEVKELVQKGKTYVQISDILKSKNSNERGISPRSVRTFCCANRIDKKNLFGKDALDLMVEREVSQVCKAIVILFYF